MSYSFSFFSLSSFLLANVYPTKPLHTAWTGLSSSFLTYRLLPESFVPLFPFLSFSFLLPDSSVFFFYFLPGYCYEGTRGAARYAIWELSETTCTTSYMTLGVGVPFFLWL